MRAKTILKPMKHEVPQKDKLNRTWLVYKYKATDEAMTQCYKINHQG